MNAPKPRKTIVIGLDGASWDVLDPLMAQGRLPHLAALAARGARAVCRSTTHPISPVAWSSVATGRNPGKHGIFDFAFREAGSYRLLPVSSYRRCGATFWDIASAAGLQCGIFNLPVTYPPRPLRGFMVTSIFTPSNRVCFTHPPNLSAELNALVDGYEITTREVFNPGHERAYVDSILRTIDKRQRALDWLLDRHPIDCGILVYNESDTVQHKLWPAEGFAGGDVPWPASGVVEVYRRLDLAVGRLVQRLGPDANFLVVSDHGAGPLRGVMCINLWLIQQGYLRLRRSAGYLLKWLLARTDLLVRTYGVLQRIGLGGLGRFVPNALRHSVATSFVSFDDVDWQRTRAYSHGEFGQIYLNLRGREPQGVVAPGQEADRLLGEIFDGLRRLVDPATGRPVVTQLWRRDELYRGPKAADGPDLVFVIDDYARDASVQFGLGRSQVLGEPEFVDRGCHRPEGIFIAAGPDIASGARPDQVSVMDVMPTALHLLGLPVPQDVDGRVLAEVLTGQAAARPLERSAAAACAAPAADAQPFSDDEQQQVKQRLRDLGYMD